jgi:tRNA (cmo5U34)-methyltransferase
MTFDFNKIDDFDNHINLSIPHYADLNNQILKYAEYFVEPGSRVIDIGCSTGELIKRLADLEEAEYIGIDNSNLLPEYHPRIEFCSEDLREFDRYEDSSLILSVFTLQFLPRDVREEVLDKVRLGLRKYGAFIMCEKTYSEDGRLQDMTNSMYYEYKSQHFTPEEILDKERALRNSFHCYRLEDLMEQARAIGKAEIFWRSYNFVGIIVT